MYIETVADIREGKGNVKLPTRYPTVIFLFSVSQKNPGLMIYAERGDKVKVTGAGPDMNSWKVSGNKLNEEYTLWRQSEKAALTAGSGKEINDAVKKYVLKNPDNPLSLFLLSFHYGRRDDPEGFETLYDKLGVKVFDDRELVRAFSTADLMETIKNDWKPTELYLIGKDGYLDTLRMGKKRTLLVFRKAVDGMGYRDENDTLKQLRKDYPDSVSQSILAEIFMDTDSMVWQRTVKRDTLKGVGRYWMPLGLTDSVAIASGVTRLPYYIVVDNKGKKVYGGSDLKEASREFRRR